MADFLVRLWFYCLDVYPSLRMMSGTMIRKDIRFPYESAEMIYCEEKRNENYMAKIDEIG